MRLPDPSALDTAIASIARRRAACGDDCEMLPGDPVGVLRYVISHRDIARAALGEDAADALVVIRCLQAEVEHHERTFTRLARDHGKTWDQIAGYLGYGSAQAAQQRAQRIGAAEKGPPRSAPPAPELKAEPLTEAEWLALNAEAILGTARAVTLVSIPVPRLQDSVDDLREALAADPPSVREVIADLSVVMNELTESGALRFLGRGLRDEALALAAAWGAARGTANEDAEPRTLVRAGLRRIR